MNDSYILSGFVFCFPLLTSFFFSAEIVRYLVIHTYFKICFFKSRSNNFNIVIFFSFIDIHRNKSFPLLISVISCQDGKISKQVINKIVKRSFKWSAVKFYECHNYIFLVF